MKKKGVRCSDRVQHLGDDRGAASTADGQIVEGHGEFSYLASDMNDNRCFRSCKAGEQGADMANRRRAVSRLVFFYGGGNCPSCVCERRSNQPSSRWTTTRAYSLRRIVLSSVSATREFTEANKGISLYSMPLVRSRVYQGGSPGGRQHGGHESRARRVGLPAIRDQCTPTQAVALRSTVRVA